MAFQGQVNQPFNGQRTTGSFHMDVTQPEDGNFVFRESETEFNIGDRLYFWIKVMYKGLYYFLEDKHYDYTGNEFRNQNTFPGMGPPENQIKSCPKSKTTVNGRGDFCSGQEIFSETFESSVLDENKWSVEKRIAVEPDFEFVLYSNHSSVLSTGGSSGLSITPTFLSDIYGHSQLRKDLTVEDCTDHVHIPHGCRFESKLTNTYAPPMVSAQISTSGKFSFLYGRVVIEAKLPTGDWIAPQLWLQPQGFKYPKADYKAGLVNIGMMDNVYGKNPRTVKQGLILGAEEPLRSKFSGKQSLDKRWAKATHKFAVEWTPGESSEHSAETT